MADISLNEGSSTGNISSQSHSALYPKFQPVRVKALMDIWGSDDEETEDKAPESDVDSDSEEVNASFQPDESPIHESGVTIRRKHGENSLGTVSPKAEGKKEELVVKPINCNASLPVYKDKNSLEPFSESNSNNKENQIRTSSTWTTLNMVTSEKSNLVDNNRLLTTNTDSEKHIPPMVIEEHKSSNYKNMQNASSRYETIRETLSSSDEHPHQEDRIEHSTTDTPMKEAHMSHMRPVPCHSRRNLISTPQNKLPQDLGKSHHQPSSAALSLWAHTVVSRTPLQPRNMGTMDSLQTPKTSMYGHNGPMQNTPNFYTRQTKSARKPLADTSPFIRKDLQAYQPTLDSKAQLVQGMQMTRSESMSQSQSKVAFNRPVVSTGSNVKRSLELSEKPAVPLDPPRNEVLKDTKPLNVKDPERIERAVQPKAPEIRHLSSLNTCTEKNDSCIQRNENVVKESNPLAQEPQASRAVNNPPTKQQVAPNIPNVQFSIPAMVPKTKPSKTIAVKGIEYLILDTLGKGMSGEVFRVQNLHNNRLHAIKCVNLSRMDEESQSGCLEEISMLNKLQAPCIVQIFDHEIKYPMVFVVMEMGDADLSHLLKSMSLEQHLPLTMILYYWMEMLGAVKHIHDNGVIHSDLKPANFLLVRGRLKLIDFGIASSMNADMTSVVKNSAIGTLNYISPEALMDIGGNSNSPNHNVKYKINFKSDVWSLGCILYRLVYGQTPFQHVRPQWAKVSAITNPKGKIQFPQTLPDTANTQNPVYVPPVLLDVMRKCLQHSPKARPTVEQLLKIQYIPITTEQVIAPVINFPSNLLLQAKQVLNEEEWRNLTDLLEKVRLSS